MPTSRRGTSDDNCPEIIIHSSLAQNLYRQYSNSQISNTYRHDSVTSRSSTANPASGSATQPSAAQRDRSKSGGQTPREMVWVNSKERLSEMATNIRGISNALSNVALNVTVENILIVTKLSDDELPELTRRIVEWLLLWEPRDDNRDDHKNEEAVDDEHPVSVLDETHKVTTIHHKGSSKVVSTQAAGEVSESLELAVEPRSCSSGNLKVYVEDEIAANPLFGIDDIRRRLPHKSQNLKYWSPDTVGADAEKIDLVITLGGDGTVLYTSWLFQKMVPPTISFGLGSLGFMTEHEYDYFPEILDGHLRNGICCTLRMRFKCTVMRTKNPHKTHSDDLMHEMRAGGEASNFSESHTKDSDHTILNEVVVDRGPNPFVAMTELYGNYELLTSIKADGVVISTPTGSTAYSMSAGGGLVHPDIPAQLISPICPHTLSFRPLVVPDSMILHIGVPYDARSSAFVSFDGKARIELRRGDFLAINVSRYPFPKVLPAPSTSISWVQQLSRTLHWNEMKRPKRYSDGKTDNLSS